MDAIAPRRPQVAWRTDAPVPQARREPAGQTVHGIALTDDYAWMRADNWQQVLAEPDALPADIRTHLEAENAYSAAMLADTDNLKALVTRELRGRIKEDDAEPPLPDGPFAYYTRFRTGGQHVLLCRHKRGGGPEEILLDADKEASGHAFFHIGSVSHSPDHTRLAWSADDKGSELYGIRTRDLATGRDNADIVDHTDGSAVWMADGHAFLYVYVDDNHRTAKVFRHVVGTDPASDVLVVEETDPRWFIHLTRSASGRFWLTFHLPSMRATGISIPTMARNCIATKSSGASLTAQGFSRDASWPSVSRPTWSRSHAASSIARIAPQACTVA